LLSLRLNKIFCFISELGKEEEEEFLYKFIQNVDGEKDPRCLVVVFELACNIVKKMSLDYLQEVRL
jgi:hypothetical protein